MVCEWAVDQMAYWEMLGAVWQRLRCTHISIYQNEHPARTACEASLHLQLASSPNVVALDIVELAELAHCGTVATGYLAE